MPRGGPQKLAGVPCIRCGNEFNGNGTAAVREFIRETGFCPRCLLKRKPPGVRLCEDEAVVTYELPEAMESRRAAVNRIGRSNGFLTGRAIVRMAESSLDRASAVITLPEPVNLFVVEDDDAA